MSQRLGIDYARLSAINERLIYCAITGYGQDGPYRDKVGHDLNYLGYAGVLEYIGAAGAPPVLAGVQIADIGAGSLLAVAGILSAVIARAQTGRGQFVDVAMLDGAFAWNVYHLLLYQLSGQLPQRGREQLTGHYPCYAIYQTSDDRYLTVGAFEPHFWATLCRHFGREDFIASQWAGGEKRDEMFAFLRAAFRRRTLAEWLHELGDQAICLGPVNHLDEALANPQLRHRQMVVELETAAGRSLAPGIPLKLSDTPGAIRTPPPGFGEHTDSVLGSLGFGTAEIAQLRAGGVV
ncbi:MAG: CoA transferase [Deltaproteobacteria bacterium]|nr:CoA transferase [Deltaproteobacteria bacterium]